MPHHAVRLRLKPLAVALHLACTLPLMAAIDAQAQTEIAQKRSYQIAAGPLGDVLSTFADQAGISLAVDGSLVSGKSSPGLTGEYSLQEAFQRLLHNSGYGIAETAAGYVLVPQARSNDSLELGATSINAGALDATTEGSGSYASPVVSIGKGNKSLKDIPQAVSVITQQRMQDQNITNVTDALENAPGVTSVFSFTGTQFYSRGFFINSFQYDGIPLERQLYARGSSFTGQTAIYDRIEILRGPQSLLEGGGDPSGSVNLVRKRPTRDAHLELTAKAGSWDHYGTQVDVSGPLDEQKRLRGRLVADYDTSNSFIDQVGADNQTLYLALDYDLGESTTVGLGFSHERLDSRPNAVGLPNYADGSMPRFGRSTFLGSNWDSWDKTQDTYYLDLSHRFADNWQFKASVINAREQNDIKYLLRRGKLTSPGSQTGDAYAFDFFNDHWGMDAYVTGDMQLFERKLGITAGVNYSNLDGDYVWGGLRNHIPSMDVFNYAPDDNEPTNAQIFASSQWLDSYDSRQRGIYATANYALTDALTVVLGGRVSDYENIYGSDGPWGVSESKAKKSGELTPYAGLIYALDEHWSTYASYSEIFKPQTSRSESGNILAPQIGKGYEIGLKGSLYDDRLQTSLALYHIEQENVPMPDDGVDQDIADSACGGTCYVPSGLVTSRGLELEMSGELARGLQVYAAYTLNLTEYRDEPPSVTINISALGGVPKHMLRTWVNYQLPGALEKLSVGGGVNAQSRSSGFGDVGREQGGYSIWNSRVAYQFDEHLSAALNLNNIFDKRYYSGLDYGYNYFGEPRNLMATLKYSY